MSNNINVIKCKRKKFELTVAQKYEIIKYHERYPSLKQVALITYFNKEFGVEISKSTMSELLSKQKKKIIQLDDVENDFNKRIWPGKYPDLEECLFVWYGMVLSKNCNK